MKFDRLKKLPTACALFVLALFTLPLSVSAQQITYYNFDTPQATTGQTSYSCPTTGPAANILFCFDNFYGTTASPSYLSDTYPANINPGGTNPNYAVLLTPAAQYQASSMWFGVPQQVSSGFNAYFAFKITPDPTSYATADGFAFVIQNSQTGGTPTTSNGFPCTSTGMGADIVGGAGGCIGYGGIDNSLAIEFDTFQNPWDPDDEGVSPNDNHVAVQSCGTLPNSPDHTGSCLVTLGVPPVGTPSTPAINNPALVLPAPGVTLADGNVHQVVIVYSGPTEVVPNLLQVYIDPAFNPTTHTPVTGSVPVISGIYNLAGNLNLSNGTSAYVGFTSATGYADEQHELLAWTYTPHTSVTQQQPLNPPGTPTPFPFGGHTYTVTYPPAGPPTSGINMVVTANTISEALFQLLAAGGPFQGAQCQVYDETGGNCVVYSVSCNEVINGVTTPEECPAVAPGEPLITVLSSYNSATTPPSPGFLQGDPFYSAITSITPGGGSATVLCTGECAVTAGQTVKILGSSDSGYNTTITVGTVISPNQFTFTSTDPNTATGGYLNSTNVQNIFYSYTPAMIDSGVTGKTKQFSDLVVTSVTPAPTALAFAYTPAIYGQPALVTVTATSTNGNPTGSVLISVDGALATSSPLTPLAGGTSGSAANFSLTGLTAGTHTLTVSYPSTGVFLGNTLTPSPIISIAQATPAINIIGAPPSAIYNSSFPVSVTTTGDLTPAIVASGGACSISGGIVTITSGTGSCLLSAATITDTDFLAGSTSVPVLVAKAPSKTTITSDTPNPSVIQGLVSLAFSVTGNGNPTGSYTVLSSVAGDPVPSCIGTLPAVQCSVTFSAPGPRTITVSYSGDGNFTSSTAMVVQSVGASPIASISPSSLNFGTLYQGGIGVQSVTVSNIGDAAMTLNEPFLFDVGNGDSKEFIALSLCPGTLQAGKSCTIIVGFVAGPSYNTQTAILKIMDNAPGNPQSVPLTAMVIDPVAKFTPGSLTFASQKVGTTTSQSVLLSNSGGTPLTVSGVKVTGTNATDFAVSGSCPASLAPGASCSLSVSFTPLKTGSRTASISVSDNMQSGSSLMPLSGTGK